MSALAELLVTEGAAVSGSDVSEQFFTDRILEKNGIPVHQGFSAANVPSDADFVIYSPAYNPLTHEELLKARELGYDPMEYTRALGEYSASIPMAAVAGVHGKTTTTALIGTIIREIGLPGKVLVGSAVSNFGGSPTYSGGSEFFVAETCEYRRHFLDFNPRHLLITSIEADHLDYFKDEEDVRSAFRELMDKLPAGGTVVYCHDDHGARETVEGYAPNRPELKFVPYGFTAPGDYGITLLEPDEGYQRFTLAGGTAAGADVRSDAQVRSGGGTREMADADKNAGGGTREMALVDGSSASGAPELRLPYPGRHSLLNAAGALALLAALRGDRCYELFSAHGSAIVTALSSFSGTSRRSEIIADINGIRIIDDYAHHPTAIRTTLAGYREMYGKRRIVVDFMSHTYSRTAALLEEFAAAFSDADILFLNGIYASAREHNAHGITGETLYEETRRRHVDVRYVPDFNMAAEAIFGELRSGDVLVTMGAGNNWTIGRAVEDMLNAAKTDGLTVQDDIHTIDDIH